jgi:signal transduction histidine kinase
MALAIEDYLNVSRIEAGNMKYSLTDFNLRDEVERIVNDLRPEALKQGLVLLFRTDLSSQGIVHADIGKVQQILHNLINNAIKYTPKGSIVVYMREQKRPKRIYIDITDTGIGMSEHTLHTIFQKFERADNANSVNVKGTGLGLYVALKMAEAMGGTINAFSEGEGKGSRFTIELPLAM